jgi:hypothetical protein
LWCIENVAEIDIVFIIDMTLSVSFCKSNNEVRIRYHIRRVVKCDNNMERTYYKVEIKWQINEISH